jgi:hypothetical protein
VYNSGKPWGKYGAVYYQQHIINWRELLVWIHKNSIDVDHRQLYWSEHSSLYNQLNYVRWDSLGIHQMDQPYMIYGFETVTRDVVSRHMFRVRPEVIF